VTVATTNEINCAIITFVDEENATRINFIEREKLTLNNLDVYRKNVETYNNVKGLIMETNHMDTQLLKSIADHHHYRLSLLKHLLQLVQH